MEHEEALYEKEIEDKIKELKEDIAKVRKVNEDLKSKNHTYEKEYNTLKQEDDEL